jgi:hypothetical protein
VKFRFTFSWLGFFCCRGLKKQLYSMGKNLKSIDAEVINNVGDFKNTIGGHT